MKTIIVLALLLPGCAYRYGTGYFIAGDKKEPEPDHYPMTLPSAAATAPEPIPCPEAKSTIEVKNTLDSKTNTITTTATSTHTRADPCFQ